MSADPRKVAINASLAVAVLMLAGKFLAYYVTGSSAILSDAAESVVHIGATAIAAFSLWYSSLPPDQQHPYGHGKINYFSAGLEGALLCFASLGILVTGVDALIRGPELHDLGLGLAITAALGTVNLFLGVALIQTGKRSHSLVLVANGHHVLADMWTSLAVLVGVGVVWATGIAWLDPVIAIAAGLQILATAFRLMRQAFHGLMERADPDQTRRIVACLDDAVADGLIASYHQLRHRAIADDLWIDMHLLVPGQTTVTAAHRDVTEVERRIRQLFAEGSVIITSHIEPIEDAGDHPEDHSTGAF